MIEWKPLPEQPGEVLNEDYFLIYLPSSGRAISAEHDAMNGYFVNVVDDTQHVFPYRCVSHYAEMDWPVLDDGHMIDECEHGKVLVCEECAMRNRS